MLLYQKKKKRRSLFCSYYPPIISLLVLATEKRLGSSPQGSSSDDSQAPRLFTESPILISPALRKEDRKCKHLELIIFASCRNAFVNYDSGLCQFRRLISELFEMYCCYFYKITVEHNFAHWITQGFTCRPVKQAPAEVQFQGKRSPLWTGLRYRVFIP